MKKIIVFLLSVMLAAGICGQDAPYKLNELMEAYVKLHKFNGTVLVAKGSKILFEKGYGLKNAGSNVFNDTGTIFQIASLSKQFTAMVVLKLAEFGKLSLNDKLAKYYPGFPKADSIRIENLLTHTSGISDESKDTAKLRVANEQKLLARIINNGFEFSPGTRWGYSNAGYTLLAYIIEKVSGTSYEKTVRKFIFEPLGMINTGFDFIHLSDTNKATGYAVFTDSTKKPAHLLDSSLTIGCGSIYSTVGDLYKWHQALQTNRLISKDLLEKAYTAFAGTSYGYGFFIDSMYNKRLIWHGGDINGFKSWISQVTTDDVCIVLLNNTDQGNMQTIASKIMAVIYDQPYNLTVLPVAKKEVALSEEILKKYAGAYELASPHMIFEISIENGQLFLQCSFPRKGPKFRLLAEKENFFFVSPKQAQFSIQFITDVSGKISKLLSDQLGVLQTMEKMR